MLRLLAILFLCITPAASFAAEGNGGPRVPQADVFRDSGRKPVGDGLTTNFGGTPLDERLQGTGADGSAGDAAAASSGDGDGSGSGSGSGSGASSK